MDDREDPRWCPTALRDLLIELVAATACPADGALDGALLLVPARSVHTLGMRFAIDVAWLDGDLTVLRIASLPRHRLSRPVLHARSVLEAEAGSFERWRLAVGDRLERGA